MSTAKTHADLKVGRWYLRYGQLVYIHDRIVKGQAGRVTGTVPFPMKLDKACGPNCGILKKQPVCPTCTNKGIKVDFTGGAAPMVSYVISEVQIQVDKFTNSFWNVSTSQVTSRSIGSYIEASEIDRVIWPIEVDGKILDDDPTGTSWKDRNGLIDKLAHDAVTVLKQKPKDSDQLQKTAVANKALAAKLYKELLNKMTPAEFKGVSGTNDPLETFRDRNMFMANIVGGGSQYDWYSPFTPSQNATVTQLVLKVGMRDHPDHVAKILDCFKKVEKAKSYEEKPFEYDPAWVSKILSEDKFAKPVAKVEVILPF